MVNTAIAAAFGAISAMLWITKRTGKPDPGMMANGMLAGLVAITAPCAFVTSGGAALIGAIAGVLVVVAALFIALSFVMVNLVVDLLNLYLDPRSRPA